MEASFLDMTRRLQKMNHLLGTLEPEDIHFDETLLFAQFYCDFNDTNHLVKEAGLLFRKDTEQLLDISFSLLSESDKFLSLGTSGLQAVDFKAIFEEHVKPFELRYEEAKTVAAKLWREYSAMSNRLDFLPLDSEEYKSLDVECDAAKVKYDEAHAQVDLLYKVWQQEQEKYFCVYCFKPMFLDVLVERLKGIAGSIISDIMRMKGDNP